VPPAILVALETRDWLAPVATLITGLITAILVIRQLSALRRRNEFDILSDVGDRLRVRFRHLDAKDGAHPFYALRHRFEHVLSARDTHTQRAYERGLADRVRAFGKLTEAEYRADLAIVEPVVNLLNEVAEVVDNRYVDHHKLLARYHLLLIREVFIAEPYVIREVVLGTRGRWGMRVLELGWMARRYNDMNPLHRRSVFYLRDQYADEDYGAIHGPPEIDGPRTARRAWWAIRRSVRGYPRIDERTKRRQNDMISRLGDLLQEARSKGFRAPEE
jgi:hypothetical protein